MPLGTKEYSLFMLTKILYVHVFSRYNYITVEPCTSLKYVCVYTVVLFNICILYDCCTWYYNCSS